MGTKVNATCICGVNTDILSGITGILVDVRLVLRDALLTGSTSLILVHNHPSGNLEPSQTDLSLPIR